MNATDPVRSWWRWWPRTIHDWPPAPLELMLRVCCLQQWTDLSDLAAEDALHDTSAYLFRASLARMERPLRLLLVSFVADVPWTGMGHWTHEIKEALQALGDSVDTWFADDFPRIAALGRFAVLAFPLALAARLMANRRSYDAVVVHEPSGFWYGVLRKLNRRLPPLIAMCHNVESRHFRTMARYARSGLAAMSLMTRARAPLLRHWQSDGTIRLADRVVCLSSADARYITTRLGVAPDRVAWSTNGVAPGDFVPRRPGSVHGTVLWVGGWLDVKGRRVLPGLWRTVREEVPECRLILAGTGVAAEQVLAAFDARDRPEIKVLPRLARSEDVRALYATSDVYLMCSLSEGSPLSLLAAMAAGIPPVATRVGGIPDLVIHEKQGLLFEPDDVQRGAAQVARLLRNASEAHRLGDAARERARALPWAATAAVLARAARNAGAPI